MGYIIRQIEVDDYAPIIQVVDAWWDNRPMASMLPRLFFIHFQKSSFVVEDGGKRVGFLVGFRSQTYPRQAYIHFVGVDPSYRNQGIGRLLYLRFFTLMREWGCTEVHSVTSPQNKSSIAFHQRLDFTIQPGDAVLNGLAVTTNYDGRGGTRVLLKKSLTSEDHY
ncbi:GNAT family N-acetyltransferase [Dictyobacter arantiisoli]|uniref:N-acetyltransferase n=1 Tax=Dictyobacter arantiisoli TaxID=2014874 RepID=A0A5A5TJQ7_9CHLR|nr:GNAT family N-acetyltransferase [Dictyobacter arantiisoli]GCF11124.1 N-acetyltransferase [Dictyobacter arantiisoli]